jgi:hypothetical protein
MFKTLSVMIQERLIVPPHFVNPQQQLTKIHQTSPLTMTLISFIDTQELPGDWITAMIDMLWSQPFVLAAIDKPSGLPGWPFFLIEVEGFYYPAYKALLVIGIDNLKTLR